MTKNIKIVNEPKYIIVSKFESGYVHYHMNNLNTVNKHCDIGVWRVKQKKSD